MLRLNRSNCFAAAPEFGAGQRDAMIAALSGVREDMQGKMQ